MVGDPYKGMCVVADRSPQVGLRSPLYESRVTRPRRERTQHGRITPLAPNEWMYWIESAKKEK